MSGRSLRRMPRSSERERCDQIVLNAFAALEVNEASSMSSLHRSRATTSTPRFSSIRRSLPTAMSSPLGADVLYRLWTSKTFMEDYCLSSRAQSVIRHKRVRTLSVTAGSVRIVTDDVLQNDCKRLL